MAHLKLLLLPLWVGVTVSMVVDLHKRIIGGKECPNNERQYHVKLNGTNGTHTSFCGGSLIHPRWVLTAAHCWKDGWNLTALLGIHPRTSQEQAAHITRGVLYFENDIAHDIMLLKLSEPSTITPVNLPNCTHGAQRPQAVQIAGYASTKMGPKNERQPNSSRSLQCAVTDVVNCRRHYNPEHVFCGQRTGVDACFGDSGGGVVNNSIIYGVISFTENVTHACTDPAGFMDVCGYIEWIRNTIAGHI